MIAEQILAPALRVCAVAHLVQIPAVLVVRRGGLRRFGAGPQTESAAFERAGETAFCILLGGTGLVVVLGASEIAGGGVSMRALAGVLGLFWLHRAVSVVRLYAGLWPPRGAGLALRWLLGILFAVVSAVYWAACWHASPASGALP